MDMYIAMTLSFEVINLQFCLDQALIQSEKKVKITCEKRGSCFENGYYNKSVTFEMACR